MLERVEEFVTGEGKNTFFKKSTWDMELCYVANVLPVQEMTVATFQLVPSYHLDGHLTPLYLVIDL